MFGIVMHDYMTDILKREFTIVYGQQNRKLQKET